MKKHIGSERVLWGQRYPKKWRDGRRNKRRDCGVDVLVSLARVMREEYLQGVNEGLKNTGYVDVWIRDLDVE